MMNKLALLIACAPMLAMAQDSMNHVTALAAGGGRFVFGQISSQRQDQYMLDTQTGRLWTTVCLKQEAMGRCSSVALQPVPYGDVNGNPVSYLPSVAPNGRAQP